MCTTTNKNSHRSFKANKNVLDEYEWMVHVKRISERREWKSWENWKTHTLKQSERENECERDVFSICFLTEIGYSLSFTKIAIECRSYFILLFAFYLIYRPLVSFVWLFWISSSNKNFYWIFFFFLHLVQNNSERIQWKGNSWKKNTIKY